MAKKARKPRKQEKAAPRGLPELRKAIDSVDDQVLALLGERAKLASEVGEAKRSAAAAPGFYDPEREKQVLARLSGAGGGVFPAESVPYVFKEIISACRSLEIEMRIAYLGPQGTYTQIAARRTFGQSVQLVEAPTIQDVFLAVERDQAEYGIVPIENSYEGGVAQTLDALAETELKIRAETLLDIDHCLLSKETALERIQRVYSHPHALAQCRRWLAENLPQAEAVPAKSTAAAAKIVAEEGFAAAIASHLASEIFGVPVLRDRIQNRTGNRTRFILLHREDAARTGRDRTSLVLSPKGPRESLPDLLDVFQKARIRVSRLESRPTSAEPWAYRYFLDIEGHRTDARVVSALTKLSKRCRGVKVLGSFPAG